MSKNSRCECGEEDCARNSSRKPREDRSRSPIAAATSASSSVKPDVGSKANSSKHLDDTADACRICRSSDCPCDECEAATKTNRKDAPSSSLPSFNSQLINVCKCTGSVRYVHSHCLTSWLKHSMSAACELCKESYPLRVLPEEVLQHRQERQLEEQQIRIFLEQERLEAMLQQHRQERLQWEVLQKREQQEKEQRQQRSPLQLLSKSDSEPDSRTEE